MHSIEHGTNARPYEVGNGLWETLLQNIEESAGPIVHFNARSLDEAVYLLRSYAEKGARVVAGGVDIIRLIKQKYSPALPGVLVDIKDIPGLANITEEKGFLRIGALACLSDIEASGLVKTRHPILAEAASVVGSPQVRNMATLAGSLCQDLCCWYYKASGNYFQCLRKGGTCCHAEAGDHRWMFSIFGASEGCFATCQSDVAIALTALGAVIKTTQRSIPIEQFYLPGPPGTVLKPDEIITEIQLPVLPDDTRMKYSKFSIRKTWDHPLVSVACVAGNKRARIVLGGVSFMPHTATGAEEIIRGKEINEELAEKAGEAAVGNAVPMPRNAWKVVLTRTLVKRTLLSLAESSGALII